jgi:DUF4097 and DUF4098 domain-containing protein YvlB
MSNERDRILKLLEDGKITADQATRLIEALGPDRSAFVDFAAPPDLPFAAHRHFRLRRGRRDLDQARIDLDQARTDLGRARTDVASAVRLAMKCGFEPGEVRYSEFAGKRHLQVKSVSGDLVVNHSDEAGIKVAYSGGMVKARPVGERVVVQTMAGDVSAGVPADGRLDLEVVSGDVSISEAGSHIEVKTVSGDVDITRTACDVRLKTVSGDVNLNRVAGDFDIETRSGDVDIVPSGPISGRVFTVAGDVTIALPKDADLIVEMDIEEDGDFEVDDDLPHEVLEESDGHMKVKFGAGSRTLVVKTRDGDIDIRLAEEEQDEHELDEQADDLKESNEGSEA